MLRRLTQISLLLLSAWLLTGPLAILQLSAWTWMVASYSQESSLEQAIAETFGNERPCDLCRAIDAVEDKGPAQNAQQPGDKGISLMLGLSRVIQVIAPSARSTSIQTIVCEPKNTLRSVPTPPPRSA